MNKNPSVAIASYRLKFQYAVSNNYTNGCRSNGSSVMEDIKVHIIIKRSQGALTLLCFTHLSSSQTLLSSHTNYLNKYLQTARYFGTEFPPKNMGLFKLHMSKYTSWRTTTI